MFQVSYLYMTTEKTIALSLWTFVGKVMSLLFNMLARFVDWGQEEKGTTEDEMAGWHH